MGYNTTFEGRIEITPPLNGHEIAYLREFSETRHMIRANGPYVIGDSEYDVRDANRAPEEQPGLWCGWAPTEDGTALEWDGVEKFYNSLEWMAYVITTFLKPDATVAGELPSPVPGWVYPAAFQHFTFDHVPNGVIDAQGARTSDSWQVVVANNKVTEGRPGQWSTFEPSGGNS